MPRHATPRHTARYGPVQANRFCVLDFLGSMGYEQRDYFWRRHVLVQEKLAKTMEWIDVDGPFADAQPEEVRACVRACGNADPPSRC